MTSSLVIPALNRDGDCLSDLVLALFGSIAGAESVLLALDEDLRPVVAMAEAPHGTAPSLMGKNVANPMAMLLACAAVLDHAAQGDPVVVDAAAAIRRATLGAAADGIRTFDLGGEARRLASSTRCWPGCVTPPGADVPGSSRPGFASPGDGASSVSTAPNLARGLAHRQEAVFGVRPMRRHEPVQILGGSFATVRKKSST